MSYLSKIRNQSPQYKERFALVVAGVVTLFILGVWLTVTLGNNEIMAENEYEVGPFESLRASVLTSLGSLSENLEVLNRNLDKYGRQ